jgi:hypothetical protein
MFYLTHGSSFIHVKMRHSQLRTDSITSIIIECPRTIDKYRGQGTACSSVYGNGLKMLLPEATETLVY